MIYKSYDKSKITVDKKEVLRYAAHKTCDDCYTSVLEKCISDVLNAAEPKIIYERVPIKFEDKNVIDFGYFKAESKNLAKNMKNACESIIFAATLGHNCERLLMKNRTDSVRLLFCDAAATAILESIANDTFSSLKETFMSENKFLRPRFSPGYGDFKLEHQKDIFRILDLERKLGMILTEKLFILPSKSITAICAVVDSDENCTSEGCEVCDRKYTCVFSRTVN